MNRAGPLTTLPVRAGCVIAGSLFVLAAIRLLRRPQRSPGSALVVRALRLATGIATRAGLFQRRGDAADLVTRLAVAPRCWPARVVARTVEADGSTSLEAAMAGLRLASALATGCASAAVALALLGTGTALVVGSCAAGAGSHVPDLVLRRAAFAALRRASTEVAAALDLLAAAAATGMSLRDALETSAAHAPPAVAAVLRAAAVRITTGSDPRLALAVEADRFDLAILGDVGGAVERQRRLGTPLAPELRRLAARQRADERAYILERAARRGPLATLVVALVIAPTCLAALTACLVGGLLQNPALGLR